MSVRTRSVAAVFFLGFIASSWLLPDRADAIPAFSRQHKTECSTCHTIYPELNEFGDAFLKNGYVYPGKKQVQGSEQATGRESGNEWSVISGLPQQLPVSLTATVDLSYDDDAFGDNELDLSTRSLTLQAGGTIQPASTTFGSACVRCHTTTGYLNFVNSGFSDLHPWGDPADKTKEVTGCNACHDNGAGRSYGYQVRSLPPVTIYYNYSSGRSAPTVKLNNKPTVFPDIAASNVCLPCHSGRGIGPMIKDAAQAGLNFTNASSPGAHYRAAGAVLLLSSGYEYQGRSYENLDFQHKNVGLRNTRGTGNKGPCITCHMANSSSHLFLPVTLDETRSITGIVSTSCVKCHDGVFQPRHNAESLESAKEGFAAALALLNKVREGKVVSNNWNAFSPGNGANTMGASFNYSMLAAEPGAFAHNPLYTRRLIYDSIDWISNASMDNDVAAAINAVTLTAPLTNPVTKVRYTTAEIAGLQQKAIDYLTEAGGVRP